MGRALFLSPHALSELALAPCREWKPMLFRRSPVLWAAPVVVLHSTLSWVWFPRSIFWKLSSSPSILSVRYEHTMDPVIPCCHCVLPYGPGASQWMNAVAGAPIMLEMNSPLVCGSPLR
jgi:hypothetical protein